MTRKKFIAMWDMEADGLLKESTTWHCLWVKDCVTGEKRGYADQPGYTPIKEGLKWLLTADAMVAHNGIDYDERMVRKFYPEEYEKLIKIQRWDTLILMKALFPPEKLWDLDMKLVKTGRLPQKYAKRYSLESLGARLGVLKGGYEGGWAAFNRDMYDYNEQDVEVQEASWLYLCKHLGWDPFDPDQDVPTEDGFIYSRDAMNREQEVHRIILEQQWEGFGFDKDGGVELARNLGNRKHEIETQLVSEFGSWWVPLDDPATGHIAKGTTNTKLTQFPDVTIPRVSEKTGKPLKDYVGPPLQNIEEGSAYVRIKWHTFSPGSREDIAERLQVKYGWVPIFFGDTGKPTLDEGTIKNMDPEVVPQHIKDLLMEYFVTAKTAGMLSEGKKAWLNVLGLYDRFTKFPTPTIHCAIGTLDAITGRGIHREPNLSQVPGVMKDKQKNILMGYAGRYGYECRSKFRPTRPDWEQTGTDVSALEFVMLGHDLARYDNWAFSNRVSDPSIDIHEAHSALTDLTRQDTKTVGYMYLFGAGPMLVGEAVGYEKDEEEMLLASDAVKSYVSFMRRKMGSDFKPFTNQELAWIGKGSIVMRKFERGIVGLKDLKKDLKEAADVKGYLKMLGGDRVWVKKPHLALNYRMQGNGARICKAWMIELNERVQREGLVWGRDYTQLMWAHDEMQFQHIPGQHELFKHHSDAAIKTVGERLGVRGTLRTDSKLGRNWAECH